MHEEIKVSGKKLHGFIIELEPVPLVLIKGAKGYLMCSYLNIETANKLGQVAGVVSGVKSFEDVLNATVKVVSEKAKTMGLHAGMKAKDFLEKIS